MLNDIEDVNRNEGMEARRQKEKADILAALSTENKKPAVIPSEVSELADDQTALRKYLKDHKDPEAIRALNEQLGIANDPTEWAKYEAQKEKKRAELLKQDDEEKERAKEERRKERRNEKYRRARAAGREVDSDMSFSDTSDSNEGFRTKARGDLQTPEPVDLPEIDLGRLPTATVTPMVKRPKWRRWPAKLIDLVLPSKRHTVVQETETKVTETSGLRFHGELMAEETLGKKISRRNLDAIQLSELNTAVGPNVKPTLYFERLNSLGIRKNQIIPINTGLVAGFENVRPGDKVTVQLPGREADPAWIVKRGRTITVSVYADEYAINNKEQYLKDQKILISGEVTKISRGGKSVVVAVPNSEGTKDDVTLFQENFKDRTFLVGEKLENFEPTSIRLSRRVRNELGLTASTSKHQL